MIALSALVSAASTISTSARARTALALLALLPACSDGTVERADGAPDFGASSPYVPSTQSPSTPSSPVTQNPATPGTGQSAPGPVNGHPPQVSRPGQALDG